MATLFECPLEELKDFENLQNALQAGRGPLMLSGCIDSERVHVAQALMPERQMRLWVTYNDTRAAEIAEDARVFGSPSWVYPAKDLLFYQADIQGNLLVKQRMGVLQTIIEEQKGTVVCTIDGLMERVIPEKRLMEKVISLTPGDRVDSEELIRRLSADGYERSSQVDASGQFAVRGGIIDVFPLTTENPIRIEFWDAEIDTIREFDAETQRSLNNLDMVHIFPAAEDGGTAVSGRELVSLLQYFPKGMPIFLDEPLHLEERARLVAKEFQESMVNRMEKGMEKAHEIPVLFSVENVFEALTTPRTVAMTGLDQQGTLLKTAERYTIQAQTVSSYQSHMDLLIKDLQKWKREKARVVLLAGSAARAERLARDLQQNYDISAAFTLRDDRTVMPGHVLVTKGSLHKGFAYPMMRFYVLTEGDLFGKEKQRRRKKSSEGKPLTSISSLSVGDYVIHENHGLGIYRGTERIEVNGVSRDYMKITYGDGGNLYVPVTQMDLVQKYAGADAEKVPALNRLGGHEWSKTKTRVKKAVKEIASELVRLYAARQTGDGFVYGPDTEWQREFEEQFPYEETDDQLTAIEAAKADMESGKIMDRLICGDVGFGKTEIAIRAAFKAVQDSKQVAYLVPTTILAQQHYHTFAQRLKDYPVEVRQLCRFNTPGEQSRTVAGLKSGEVDVVIGTHRLLSKDVKFRDLGLLIIDEEQRFGVSDKEKIKQMKETVDVLSLTATPIPRTLHMSLIGVRDMSILQEAPIDRMPIQTYVMEYNDELVREAITRELSRGGQVYYVYNRVENIAEMTAHIRTLVPDGEVAYAHGQMKERELEKIMLDFINGDIDVLVSTTIVETGLDISNVNTILIHDADRFGLAQLYQLRGRVGRSSRNAYAFLLYRKNKMLKEIAEKRLSAIREYTELGSGLNISMRDLELRGAGNILGAEQHGHMEAVGYDLYCKLLGSAVRELKGEEKAGEDFETRIELEIDAYLPDAYVRNEAQRMGLYRKIAGVETDEDREDMVEELIDRFGNVPVPVLNLLKVAILRKEAHGAKIVEINGNKESLLFTLYEGAEIHPDKVVEVIGKYRGDLRVAAQIPPSFRYRDQRKTNTDEKRLLENIREMIRDIGKITEEIPDDRL